jgi:Icc-related predicted phosphoesterase
MRSDATKLKLLLLSDLEGQIPRVNQLCEELVSSEDCDVDAVLVAGGLVAKRGPHEYEALEAVAAAEGDMMALISRLEMIICRVLYIPDEVCSTPLHRTRQETTATPILTKNVGVLDV